MALETADMDTVFAKGPKRQPAPTSTHFIPFHSYIQPFVNKPVFKGPCEESTGLAWYMGKQDVLKARRCDSSWADAQPVGTVVPLEGAPTPPTAPARRHLLMLQQVFEVNHLHNDLDVLLGSGAEVMLQVALPL